MTSRPGAPIVHRKPGSKGPGGAIDWDADDGAVWTYILRRLGERVSVCAVSVELGVNERTVRDRLADMNVDGGDGRRRGFEWTPELRMILVAKRAAGTSFDAIAFDMGVGVDTVRHECRRLNLPVPSRKFGTAHGFCRVASSPRGGERERETQAAPDKREPMAAGSDESWSVLRDASPWLAAYGQYARVDTSPAARSAPDGRCDGAKDTGAHTGICEAFEYREAA